MKAGHACMQSSRSPHRKVTEHADAQVHPTCMLNKLNFDSIVSGRERVFRALQNALCNLRRQENSYATCLRRCSLLSATQSTRLATKAAAMAYRLSQQLSLSQGIPLQGSIQTAAVRPCHSDCRRCSHRTACTSAPEQSQTSLSGCSQRQTRRQQLLYASSPEAPVQTNVREVNSNLYEAMLPTGPVKDLG